MTEMKMLPVNFKGVHIHTGWSVWESSSTEALDKTLCFLVYFLEQHTHTQLHLF